MELKIENKTLVKIFVALTIFLIFLKFLNLVVTPLVWVGIASFLALALEPAVATISRFMPRKNRLLALIIVFLLFVGGLVLIGGLLVPPLVKEVSNLSNSVPDYYNDFLRSQDPIALYVKDNISAVQNIDQEKIGQIASAASGWLFNSVAGLFSSLAAFFTILTFTFFMVLEGPQIVEYFWAHFPKKDIERRKKNVEAMYKSVTGYVNATLLRGLIAAVITVIFLTIIGVPYAFSLGILVGLADLIPLVGATIGAVVVIFLALIFGGIGPAITSTIFFVIYQIFENAVIQPLTFSKTINISPLVTAIAAVIGAFVAGFVGALVAIPIAASIQILVRDYLEG